MSRQKRIKQLRIAVAISVAAIALLATAIPANAFGFLMPTRFSSRTIERLAPYVPQSTCSPAAKIGTRSLLALLERKYPGTGSDGISRSCDIGGRSEHKEGRALDWAVNYYNPSQRAQADSAINWLLKKDKMGRAYANARRLGVMYIIWNRQIWSADQPGWRAYSGASGHRDHVHISLSWAGAQAKTSFWTGKVLATAVNAPTPGILPSATVTTSATPTVTASAAPSATPTGAVTSTGTVASSHGEETWYWEKFRD